MRPRPRIRASRLLLFAVVAVLINLPVVHGWWLERRIDQHGVDVAASVVETEVFDTRGGPRYWVVYTLPEGVDAEQQRWAGAVDAVTFARARDDEAVQVRVVPGSPSVHRLAGRDEQGFGLAITLVADAALVLALLLYLAVGRRHRVRRTRLIAVCDVTRAAPGYALAEGEGGLWEARGEVVTFTDEEVVLDVGESGEVVVALDGYANPVGYQQTARAIGRRA